MTNHQLTYIGPLMANKREIPPILREEMSLHETKFVLVALRRRSPCALTTRKQARQLLCCRLNITTLQFLLLKRNSNLIILEYNGTKAGVDAGDQMCRTYSTRSTTKRWPVVHFQNLLDVGGMNAHTIYELNHPNWTSIPIQNRRRKFLSELAIELAKPYMRNRLGDPVGLRENLRRNMTKYTGDHHQSNQPQESGLERSKVRCEGCKADGKPTRQCNLTTQRCQDCDAAVCGKHSKIVGVQCHNCSE